VKCDLAVPKYNPVSVSSLSLKMKGRRKNSEKGFVPLCCHKSVLEMLCFDSATNRSFLDFFMYKIS